MEDDETVTLSNRKTQKQPKVEELRPSSPCPEDGGDVGVLMEGEGGVKDRVVTGAVVEGLVVVTQGSNMEREEEDEEGHILPNLQMLLPTFAKCR